MKIAAAFLPLIAMALIMVLRCAGSSQTTISGCMRNGAATTRSLSETPAEQAAAGPDVMVTASQGAAVVTHSLRHACCLKGNVATHVDGARVVVTETISGNPCRCLCASTITTTVPLATGSYTIVLMQDGADAPSHEVHSQVIDVK